MQSKITSEGNLAAIARILLARHWTVAVAESCTGGLVGAAITAIPGASAYFRGGVIVYDNHIKVAVLGVAESLLAAHGAVSGECVEAMADGVCRLMRTDCAIAVSGIAGPEGGTPEKPVGLVYIGISIQGRTLSRRHLFEGDRNTIRQAAVAQAIAVLHAAMETITGT
jgi:PncC family amidohydrolase